MVGNLGPELVNDIVQLLECERLKMKLSILWVGLFNLILETGSIVTVWKDSMIRVLFKGKGQITDTNNYRGIAMMSHAFKLFTKLLTNRILKVTEGRTLPDEQYGFRKGKSTKDAIGEISTVVKECLSIPKNPLYAVFVDFSKAFDTVARGLLINK